MNSALDTSSRSYTLGCRQPAYRVSRAATLCGCQWGTHNLDPATLDMSSALDFIASYPSCIPASPPSPPPGPSDRTGPEEKEFRIFSPSRDPSLDLVCKPLPGPVTRCRLPGMRAQASLGQAGGLAPHEDTESRPLRGRADAQGPACPLKGLALVQRTAEATLTTATAVQVPPSLRLTWRAGPAAVWVAKALCAWRHWAGVPAAPRHHACHHQYFDVGCSCGL